MSGVIATAIDMTSNSGRIRLNEAIKAETLNIQSNIGDVLLSDVTVTKTLLITCASGNIAIFDTDFTDAYLNTTDGNITGILKKKKKLDACSQSGTVNLPASYDEAEPLYIRTQSGNISFTYAEEIKN